MAEQQTDPYGNRSTDLHYRLFCRNQNTVSSGWTTVRQQKCLVQLPDWIKVTKGWQGGDMALVLVAVITIAIIGFILSVVLNKMEKVVCPWNN